MIRYPIAIVVAILLVVAGWWFVRYTHSGAQARLEHYKKELKAKKEAGELPPEFRGVDIDNLQPSQIGMRVTSGEQTRITIANALSEHAYIMMALDLAICLAVVVVVDVLRGKR